MANEDFNVSAGVKVKADSNDVQKQINKVAKDVKVKVKLNPELGDFQKKLTSLTKNNKPYVKVGLKIDEKDLNKVKKQLKELSSKSYPAIIKPSVSSQNGDKTGSKSSGYDKDTIAIINKQKDALSGLVTETEKYDAVTDKLSRSTQAVKKSNEEVIKTQKTYKNSLGEIVTETETLDVQTGQLSRNIKMVSDQTKVAQTNTKLTVGANGELIKTIQTLNEKGEVLNETVTRLNDQTKVTKEVVTKTADAMGVITTKTERFNASGQKVGEFTRVLDDQTKALKRQKEATESSTRANEGFISSMGRVLRFKIQNAIINTFSQSVYKAVDALKEIDSALVEFRKVSELSGKELDRYVAKLAELGTVTGSTISQMIEASTEFKKSGFSEEDSADLANIAQMYRNIADEELSAGDSANFIIAQMKAFSSELSKFNSEGERAMFVIDAVNEVSNNFAVSSSDLIARSCVW